jgi:hypothetical protein
MYPLSSLSTARDDVVSYIHLESVYQLVMIYIFRRAEDGAARGKETSRVDCSIYRMLPML